MSIFGSDSADNGFGSDSLSKSGVDTELQEFLMIEKQRAQLSAQVHELNNVCWDRCVEKLSTKLDSRTETCLQNCVDRFLDVTLHITNRFAQQLEKSVQGH